MDNILFLILAKFINADTIGGYVRALVAAGVSALLAWKGAALLPFLTPEVQTAVTAFLTAIAVGLWSQVSKQTTQPTDTQVVKVTEALADKGMVDKPDAKAIKANPEIVMQP